MRNATRIAIVGIALTFTLLAVSLGVPGAKGSSSAPAVRPQTLFGMDVPSLQQLDRAETAVGARAAIVGTFADWAHTPDFPRLLADQASARGAVLMISWEPWDSWRGGAGQP